MIGLATPTLGEGVVKSLFPIVLSISLVAKTALADVVPPPPRCPRGTVPETSHAGPVCLAPPPASCPPGSTPRATRAGPLCFVDNACLGVGACREHQTCREVGLCVAEIKLPGRWDDMSMKVARGVCDANQPCPEGSTCETTLRCATEAPAPAPAPTARSCDCRRLGSAENDPRPAVTFALVLALALGWRRQS